MEKKCHRLLILTLMGILMYSCQKEDDILEQTLISQYPTEGIMKLGKQLENPYSVENMSKASNNLKKKGGSAKSSGGEIEIKTTHLYVKFMPKNEDELSILKRDSTFVLYDYPLDYEIEENGYFYRDPEVPDGQPTYQYCAIKVNKELPSSVENEILAELFIPDEDNDDETISKKAFSYDNVNTLVDEALRMTNNLPNIDSQNQKSLFRRRSKWRPAGTIRVWDDNLSRWVGVEGVEVRARRWFTTHKGIANSSGYYSCDGRFRREANYSIDWERYHFALRDGWLNGATYNGPKKRGNWNLNLNSGKQEYYATIFRAAYHYYYKNIKGFRRPPKNSFWKTQLKIRAYNESNNDINGSHCPSCRFLGIGSAIKMYNPQRNSRDIYGTVIHELAHASHWSMDRSSYRNSSTIVAESWARGVQWELTRMIYSDYVTPYFTNYTGVVQDMIDGISGYDQVSGYNIRQIEDALNGQSSWVGWRNNIKNRYNNGTENNLEALFNHWD